METREWKTIKEYQDILFDFYNGIAKITINRPRYRNAFTPTTTSEISDALYYCRECQDINVVVLTGAGDKAFCSGGDMHGKGAWRLYRHRWSSPSECAGRTKANPVTA